MASRACGLCGDKFEARHKNHKWCSKKCRERARGGVSVVPVSDDVVDLPVGLVGSVTAELESARRLASADGQAALTLASAIAGGGQTGSGLAALVRELRATLTAATAGAGVVDDPVDELRARRLARRKNG